MRWVRSGRATSCPEVAPAGSGSVCFSRPVQWLVMRKIGLPIWALVSIHYSPGEPHPCPVDAVIAGAKTLTRVTRSAPLEPRL